MRRMLRALDRQGQRELLAVKLDAKSRVRTAIVRAIGMFLLCLALLLGIAAAIAWLATIWGVPAALGIAAGGVALLALLLIGLAPGLGGREAARMAKAEAKVARRGLASEAADELSAHGLASQIRGMTGPAAVGAFVAGLIVGLFGPKRRP